LVCSEIKSTKTPFLFLALDLPPPPLYRDAVESNIIPQVPIATVLAKYDGETTREDPTSGLLRRWKITRLPPFLIVYYKRFTSNRFLEEKNPTIVNFPLRGVDMHDCTYHERPFRREKMLTLWRWLFRSQTSMAHNRSLPTTT
jgi:U4/U6.U5 tri-snRNP-associated protein 2